MGKARSRVIQQNSYNKIQHQTRQYNNKISIRAQGFFLCMNEESKIISWLISWAIIAMKQRYHHNLTHHRRHNPSKIQPRLTSWTNALRAQRHHNHQSSPSRTGLCWVRYGKIFLNKTFKFQIDILLQLSKPSKAKNTSCPTTKWHHHASLNSVPPTMLLSTESSTNPVVQY